MRTNVPNREDEDEDDEPPERKHAKVKRRLVPIVSVVSRNSVVPAFRTFRLLAKSKVFSLSAVM